MRFAVPCTRGKMSGPLGLEDNLHWTVHKWTSYSHAISTNPLIITPDHLENELASLKSYGFFSPVRIVRDWPIVFVRLCHGRKMNHITVNRLLGTEKLTHPFGHPLKEFCQADYFSPFIFTRFNLITFFWIITLTHADNYFGYRCLQTWLHISSGTD